MIKIAVFCDVAPCSVVEVYRRFRCACCLHNQGGDRNGVMISMENLRIGIKHLFQGHFVHHESLLKSPMTEPESPP
jgi:hypothetical protein